PGGPVGAAFRYGADAKSLDARPDHSRTDREFAGDRYAGTRIQPIRSPIVDREGKERSALLEPVHRIAGETQAGDRSDPQLGTQGITKAAVDHCAESGAPASRRAQVEPVDRKVSGRADSLPREGGAKVAEQAVGTVIGKRKADLGRRQPCRSRAA